jgi:hypothetical protein
MIDVQKYIRLLAKSDDYQNIYNLIKDNHKVRLFKNDMDLTPIQMMFMRYLSFYNSIFTDIALGEVDEIVLEDFIYEDSYIMYKNKADKNKLKDIKKNDTKEVPVATSRWIFKSKNQKVT